jgi:hypothetical protein
MYVVLQFKKKSKKSNEADGEAGPSGEQAPYDEEDDIANMMFGDDDPDGEAKNALFGRRRAPRKTGSDVSTDSSDEDNDKTNNKKKPTTSASSGAKGEPGRSGEQVCCNIYYYYDSYFNLFFHSHVGICIYSWIAAWLNS